ncbi:MAG: chromosomal replication initiator protein DnaA [Myxococcales bacterium FL481]|nr:MAG: chromosomal replication initiator protein DnaA [Myxococcales bacterium FL481]
MWEELGFSDHFLNDYGILQTLNRLTKPVDSSYADRIWRDALAAIRPRLDAHTYEMWVRPIQCVGLDDERCLQLRAPNRFLKEWFETHYLGLVLEQIETDTGVAHRADVAVDERPPPPVEPSSPAASPAETLDPPKTTATPDPAPRPAPPASTPAPSPRPRPPIPTKPQGLSPRYHFDSFIRGASNELAASAALAVADHPGQRFNPLFLYGGVGLGKTHLLHAVGHALHEQQPDLRIVYLSAERFMNEFVSAVRHNQFDEFRAKYREQADCLLIDDIQFIAGRDRTMDEFFHVFNALYEAGKQIMVTADRVPASMQGMEERLTSRLNWGLVADIKPPDLETRIAILRQRAERDQIDIPNDVTFRLAERVQTNVRELEGALLRLATFASLRNVPITPAFLDEVLQHAAPPQRAAMTVESVQKAVANHFAVRIADLKGQRRHRGISRPRMIAMYLSRELTGASFPEIGLRFGGKDHSTVINACRRVQSLQADDPELRTAIVQLRDQLVGAHAMQ